ncbi:MAG: hypothetical protein ACOY4W_16775 [Thermodesulfobacteriota bacterium]
MNSNTEVDIVTGMPVEFEASRRQRVADAQEKDELLRQIGFLRVTESEAAASLLQLIEDRLTKRVETLVALDPEAKAFIDLLKKFGERTFAARLAARKMVEQQARMEQTTRPLG